MKIGLDVRMINHSGIGTTIRGLLDHWSLNQISHLTLFRNPQTHLAYDCDSVSTPSSIYSLSQHWSYGRLLNKHNLDLFHMPHFDVPVSYKGKLVVTIHDLIHILFPQFSTKPFSAVYAKMIMGRAVRRASKVIAVSHNTKKDLVRFFPDAESKTEVINPGVDKNFHPSEGDKVRKTRDHYKLSEPYFLYVGNLRESKNSKKLLTAYARFKQTMPNAPQLVLVGQNFYPAGQLELTAGILHLQRVPTTDLPALYSGAHAFVFPSLYEGFGLPLLEAMSCGAPCIASDRGSLPEVGGDAVLYVNPESIDEIAGAMARVSNDTALRKQLSEKGRERAHSFTWNSFSQKTWSLYESVLGQSLS